MASEVDGWMATRVQPLQWMATSVQLTQDGLLADAAATAIMNAPDLSFQLRFGVLIFATTPKPTLPRAIGFRAATAVRLKRHALCVCACVCVC